jgi:hypothetical protein
LHGRVPKPFLWGFYEKSEGFIYFNSTNDYVEHIKKFNGILYFHNGGKFDIHKYRKMLGEMFPSKYMNKRIATLENDKKNKLSNTPFILLIILAFGLPSNAYN